MRGLPNWAVFISGRGSNLCGAIDELGDQIALVVTTHARAGGVLRAKRAGIPVHILARPVDWRALTHELQLRKINKIFLLGFMKILPVEFINEWRDAIVNLHPSLLPAYPGLESIERAYQERNDLGVTVHKVIPEVDAGEILLQKKTLLGERILSQSLQEVELRIHQDEQILVRSILRKLLNEKLPE